jgi:hypothetical protein
VISADCGGMPDRIILARSHKPVTQQVAHQFPKPMCSEAQSLDGMSHGGQVQFFQVVSKAFLRWLRIHWDLLRWRSV